MISERKTKINEVSILEKVNSRSRCELHAPNGHFDTENTQYLHSIKSIIPSYPKKLTPVLKWWCFRISDIVTVYILVLAARFRMNLKRSSFAEMHCVTLNLINQYNKHKHQICFKRSFDASNTFSLALISVLARKCSVRAVVRRGRRTLKKWPHFFLWHKYTI